MGKTWKYICKGSHFVEENAQVKVSAIIVAAGASRRMGFDKLSYRLPGGKTVLETSVAAFAAHPQVDELILVAGGNLPACQAIAAACPKPCTVVGGGATRADSVCSGLRAAKGQLVAIHDAARPFVSEQVITDALAEAEAMGAAAPAVAVKDTIKIANDGAVVQTPDRAALFAVQTPQCFCRNLYWKALEAVQGEKVHLVTDDCSLFELAGLPVHLTQGDYVNLKITTKEDLPAAAQNKGENTMRIGHGYDVHRLVEGRKLIMGGVTIHMKKACWAIPMQMCCCTQFRMHCLARRRWGISASIFRIPTAVRGSRFPDAAAGGWPSAG